jgi:hypothetical protein
MVYTVSMDAYTPLLELKENSPPIGYSLLKGDNIMDAAYRICRENVRAPVVPTKCDLTLNYDFVSNTDDNWLTFLRDLIAEAKYTFELDEMGRILFSPKQDTASLQPVWTYDDDNSSILYPELSIDHDLYEIPNVVEVTYSSGTETYHARVVNDDPNSPTSTVSRGRVIKHTVVNPKTTGISTEKQIQEYAEQLLKELSSLEYSIKYSHAYCSTRVNDCIRCNYSRADLNGVKARVISQDIKCKQGVPVSEKAVFTNKLWR